MRLRHRLPGVFGLYMVDVLCCSLGCVILLWLFNDYKNALQARRIGEQRDSLDRLSREQDLREKDLAKAKGELADREMQSARLGKELAARRDDLEKLGKDLFSLQDRLRLADKDRMETRAALDKTRKSLEEEALAKARQAGLARDLAARRAEAEASLALMARELGESGKQLARKDITARELMAGKAALEKQVAALSARAVDAVEKNRALTKELGVGQGRLAQMEAAAKGLLAEKADLEKRMSGAATRASAAEKALAETNSAVRVQKDALSAMAADKDKAMAELDGMRRRLASLEAALVAETATRKTAEGRGEAAARDRDRKDKDLLDLQARMARLRQAAETRFAGVQLTGRRVVLLVDSSGSMELIRSDTASPEKWGEVARVAGLILDGLPDLEKFQVVVFSESARWLMGGTGWIDYNRETSREAVVGALSRVQPKGGTNLHEGFRLAFSLKAQGMDAIYLLSDGLPNQGEGLTDGQRDSLREQEKGELLGQYLRRKLRTEWNAETPGRPPVRVNTVGFFYESPELGSFLWALARENRGNFVGMNSP